MRLIFVLFVFAILTFAQPAHANDQKVEAQIHDVFSEMALAGYAPQALLKAQADLRGIKHPSALTAATVIAQYENMGVALTQGLLSQLGQKAKNYKLENPQDVDPTNVDKFVAKYDGSNQSLADALFWLNGREPNANIGWDDDASPSFTIPCAYFYRHPDIGRFTEFVGMNWHRFATPSLNINCHSEPAFSTNYPNMLNFWKLGGEVAYRSSACGSIYKDHAAGRRFSLNDLLYRPTKGIEFNPTQIQHSNSLQDLKNSSLFDWALMGRQNYQTFLELEALYIAAKRELSDYYRTHFEMSEEQIERKVPFALLSQIHGASNLNSFSRAMDSSLTGQRKIRARILSGQAVSDDELLAYKTKFKQPIDGQFPSMAGHPEPLLHLAIGNDMARGQMIRLGFDVDVRDALGKTALLAAAQDDNLVATNDLLAAGADISARSYHPRDVPGNELRNGIWGNRCGPYSVSTGERSALNYALSEASENVVQLLLANGADTDVVDSAGNTLTDYIEGKGPTRKNYKLPANIQDIIFPDIE